MYEVDSPSSWSFHPDHQAEIDRRRRIIAQYDPTVLGLSKTIDVQAWQAFGFQYFDQPGSQVDAIWWDCDVLPGQIYSTGVATLRRASGEATRHRVEARATDTGLTGSPFSWKRRTSVGSRRFGIAAFQVTTLGRTWRKWNI